jgi:hypothetical protein
LSAKSSKGKTGQSRGLVGKLVWVAALLVILGGAVALAIDVAQPEPPPPPELEAVEAFPDMGNLHLGAGQAVPEYNSDPPTSGPHSATPAPCGIYRQPVPDVNYLHSMEHGAIVVQYDPTLAEDQIEELEKIGRSVGGEIIVAPRPGNPAAVALTSWTNLLLLDEVDGDVIAGFEREFGNRSPEPAAQCLFQVDKGG